MSQTMTIKKNSNIKLDFYPIEYLNPKHVFMPIMDGYKLKVKDNSYVFKESVLMYTDNNQKVLSPISGVVLGVKDMKYAGGKTIPSLVIENDFKESVKLKKSSKKYLEKYNLQDFSDLLIDMSLNNILEKLENKNDIILINGIEIDTYFANKYFYTMDHAEEILEVVDLMLELFNHKKAYIALLNNNADIINQFYNLMGTYPNIEIRLLNNTYGMGLDEVLCKNLDINPITFSVKEIMDVYRVLKKRKPILEKYITITGDAVKPRSVIKVRYGTLLSEAFINNFDFASNLVDVYLNGYIKGKKINSLNLVINDDIEGLYITKKEEKNTSGCINCGQCVKYCPMDLNPKFVLDKKGIVEDKYKDKCIDCGLCNYVCPSCINLRKLMSGKDEEEI